MKKLAFILFLVSTIAFSQKHRVEVIKGVKITIAERDSFVVPVGEVWYITLTDGTKQKNEDGTGWVPDNDGGPGGSQNIDQVLQVGNNANNQNINNLSGIQANNFVLGGGEISNDLQLGGNMFLQSNGTIDVNEGQLVNANSIIMSPTDTEPTGVEGVFYADDSEDRLKYNDGTSFRPLAYLDEVQGGAGDNLGSHTATQDLDVAGNNMLNVNQLFIDTLLPATNPVIIIGTNVSFSGVGKIQSLVDGTDPQDAVTLNQLNNLEASTGIIQISAMSQVTLNDRFYNLTTDDGEVEAGLYWVDDNGAIWLISRNTVGQLEANKIYQGTTNNWAGTANHGNNATILVLRHL